MQRYVIHLGSDRTVQVDADREEWTDDQELRLYKGDELVACLREVKAWVRAKPDGVCGLYL